mmetsp:Transcript_59158/g.139407  ORF Transcript_59158/g.139407 Transcript_59158/m.139407 type:complete len:233 (-) Transcript_59158:1046-1744(-)
MGQRLADQAEVVGVELHRLEGRQRFVVQHVEISQDAPGLRVAASSHQAQPARQPQQRQGASHGLVRGLRRTRHRREIGPELVVGRERRHTVALELQAEHLPGIALQWRQAPVEEQRARHALMPVAAVEKAVADRRGRRRRGVAACSRRCGWHQFPQRIVEQRRQRHRAIAPGCAAGRHGLYQPLVDPVAYRRPDHRHRQAQGLGQVHGQRQHRHLVVQRDAALRDASLPLLP